MFSAIEYQNGSLKLLDQRLLPSIEKWLEYRDLEGVAVAIEDMVVRGAPAIASAAAYGLVVDAIHAKAKTWGDYREQYFNSCERLARTRPTAVNLFHTLHHLRNFVAGYTADMPMAKVVKSLEDEANRLFDEDLAICKSIGRNGLECAGAKPLTVMTHCNTGSLATAGYGTALGVIRSLHETGRLKHVYVDETRPFLQGARLTAYELWKEGIPYSLNVDSAAAFIMSRHQVDMVVVGADRIAANGDTANKIGTFNLAIVAKHHNVPFYVAAPLSTFDPKVVSGEQIPVEDRDSREITHFGTQAIAPEGTTVKNPSFDVTPHALISGFITEKGVLRPPFTESIRRLF